MPLGLFVAHFTFESRPNNRRAWRAFADTIGQDPTYGLMGHVRRAFSVTDVELDGTEGLMLDSPLAVRCVWLCVCVWVDRLGWWWGVEKEGMGQ